MVLIKIPVGQRNWPTTTCSVPRAKAFAKKIVIIILIMMVGVSHVPLTTYIATKMLVGIMYLTRGNVDRFSGCRATWQKETICSDLFPPENITSLTLEICLFQIFKNGRKMRKMRRRGFTMWIKQVMLRL